MSRTKKNKSQTKLAVSTVLVAIFTGVLSVVAVFQLIFFVQSQRAFVAPTVANFAQPSNLGIKYLPVYLDIQNSGNSTATIKELSVSITHNLSAKPQYSGPRNIAFPSLAAKATYRRTVRFETNWGAETISKVLSGQMKFYIFGVIKYVDGFSIWGFREIGFCYVYIPVENRGASVFENCIDPTYTYVRN